MRIAVFGATGRIGSRIVAEAVARGHEVIAIARDSGRRPDLEIPVRVADATDAQAVAAAVAGVDAVVSAIGGASSGRPSMVAEVAPSLVAGLQQADVHRLVVVGGAGGLRLPSGGRVIDDPGFPEGWKPASMAQIEALDIYRRHASSLDWTYVSPADVIEPGIRTGRYATNTDDLVVDAEGKSFISCEDYAVAVLDELEHPTTIGGRLAVGPPS